MKINIANPTTGDLLRLLGLHDGSLSRDAEDCTECNGQDLSFSWDASPWVWVIEFERETK